MRKTVLLSVAVIVAFISSLIINNISLRGAQLGGEGISKLATLMANRNPDSYYWDLYPVSLMMGGLIGLLVYVLGYIISSKKKPSNIIGKNKTVNPRRNLNTRSNKNKAGK